MMNDSHISQSINNPDVAAVFETYPQAFRMKLLFLRQLIFETAVSLDGIGSIEETLKWGEPSYLTSETRSGSTIRLGWKPSQETYYAMYFKCTANLVKAFRERYPTTFRPAAGF